MRLFKLRWRLGNQGLTLYEKGDLFLVTDDATSKRSVSHEFHTLEEVETWLRMLEKGEVTEEGEIIFPT